MIYKNLGNTGVRVSALGFGAMRLPMKEIGEKKVVDEDLAIPLIQRALDLGVNYVDTAPYYCEGLSEAAVGKAIKGRRDQVVLATKNPIEDASGAHWRERLEKSLTRLGESTIDFYHMWGINLNMFRDKIDLPDGPIAAAMKAKEEGLIRHLAFSFHDDPKNMIPIIDSGYFETVLCQYNLLDRTNEEAMAYARSRGMGVVVMGPVGGGRLGAPSESIRAMLRDKVKSTAEMALRFVLAKPNVTVALSGMSTIEQVEENAAVASIPGVLTDAELQRVEDMLQENKRLSDLYCTGCDYCMPCPMEVNIPHIFRLMNYSRVYGLTDFARQEYARLKVPGNKSGKAAEACVECAGCEAQCPQNLPIIEQLRECAAALG